MFVTTGSKGVDQSLLQRILCLRGWWVGVCLYTITEGLGRALPGISLKKCANWIGWEIGIIVAES